MTWNQPICERCWVDGPGANDDGAIRVPVRVKEIPSQAPPQCAWCGYPTWAGIFVRADPATVPYPREDDE